MTSNPTYPSSFFLIRSFEEFLRDILKLNTKAHKAELVRLTYVGEVSLIKVRENKFSALVWSPLKKALHSVGL